MAEVLKSDMISAESANHPLDTTHWSSSFSRLADCWNPPIDRLMNDLSDLSRLTLSDEKHMDKIREIHEKRFLLVSLFYSYSACFLAELEALPSYSSPENGVDERSIFNRIRQSMDILKEFLDHPRLLNKDCDVTDLVERLKQADALLIESTDRIDERLVKLVSNLPDQTGEKGAFGRFVPTSTPGYGVKCILKGKSEGKFELEASRIIEHPNIVRSFGWRVDDTECRILMERYGTSLEKLLMGKEGRMFPVSQLRTSMNYICQIFDGVGALHRLGIVHRDISPDNILISTEDKNAKLCDFGLARDLQGSATKYTDNQGKYHYMAPEVRNRTQPTSFSKQTDVFALGVVTLDILLGIEKTHSLLSGSTSSSDDVKQSIFSLVYDLRESFITQLLDRVCCDGLLTESDANRAKKTLNVKHWPAKSWHRFVFYIQDTVGSTPIARTLEMSIVTLARDCVDKCLLGLDQYRQSHAVALNLWEEVLQDYSLLTLS
uniref:Protein kinase domain-containing protein n=1 Tax=Sexangularia sp. CB-2014 TaxID=1486929 RepID=A0A7S1YDP4_9EUKA|mmetsp:Transcript_14667/g.46037  ORF Transcript_14667/g.46037 Transcript_14667/m.46037 type:complete len:491 (+) Transcript_14667:77-1549(+)